MTSAEAEPGRGPAAGREPEPRPEPEGPREAGSPARHGPLAPSLDERAAAARARGLSSPDIAGGRDPDPETGLREERFYGRLLLVMVLVIVLAGFVLGIVATIVDLARGG